MGIAKVLNKYFSTVAEKLSKPTNKTRPTNPRNRKSMFFNPISADEVKLEILKLKSGSAPGYDGITSSDIKKVVDLIAPILSKLFNDAIDESKFPDCLKPTIVVPIHKGGDRELLNNYRPISLLAVFGKVFEKLINKRLCNFIKKTYGLDENQFGFQQESSTDAALGQVVHNINKYTDLGEYVVILFIDLRKAFDMVDHKHMISILSELGIRGKILDVFKSYLTGREVSTRVGSSLSEPATLTSGVPQGSVLGPTLYLLYINSLKYIDIKGESTIYADDTCFLYHSKNKQTIETQIKEDLEKYFDWLSGNKLVINLSKTNFMVFKPKRKENIEIKLEGPNYKLERVKTTKYLGVTLDENFTWEPHIEAIKKKVSPIIGALKKCSSFDKKIAILVYNGYVISKIRPNILIWSQANKNALTKIQRMMNRALKILLKLDWYTPTNDLLEATGTFSLDELMKIEKCKYIYKVMNNKVKCNQHLRTQEDVSGRITRNGRNLVKFVSKTNRMKKGIFNSSIHEFNKLKPEIRNCSNTNEFSKKLKKSVLNERS